MKGEGQVEINTEKERKRERGREKHRGQHTDNIRCARPISPSLPKLPKPEQKVNVFIIIIFLLFVNPRNRHPCPHGSPSLSLNEVKSLQ